MLARIRTNLPGRLQRLFPSKQPEQDDDHLSPKFPPPPPLQLLRMREEFDAQLLVRRFRTPNGQPDNPLFALYRIYEYLVLNHRYGLRNEIEAFYYQANWVVSEIPDPHDEAEPERYAVLACIPHLLVRAFNARMKHGAHRDLPPIATWEEIEEVKAREKVWEEVPEWTKQVKPLAETLRIPHENNETLSDSNDERASLAFVEKNILIWEPHVLFW